MHAKWTRILAYVAVAEKGFSLLPSRNANRALRSTKIACFAQRKSLLGHRNYYSRSDGDEPRRMKL